MMQNLRYSLGQVGMGLGLSLLFAQVAIAGYQPPKKASAPRSAGTTTGTRRGCASTTQASLTALAPQAHIGHSSDGHPTFVWFMPDEKPFAMEFELYEKTATGRQNIQRQQLTSQQGWAAFTLPQTAIALSPEKDYFWQVIVYCNPNRPSSALVASARLKVEPLPPALAYQLDQAPSPLEQANLFAEAGFWYDALASLNGESGTQAQEFRAELVRNLAALEAETTSQQLLSILE